MKKRILFVDDEPLILQGLQRMLRRMRDEWEMEFVTSGAAALERLAQAPFDVVVSDMRMPGMNGAQLLNEVMRLYPHAVRLILSGHADRETVMQCVGATHQFLAKPCRAEDLKAAITRASALDRSLQNSTLQQLVSRLDRLPSLPTLYLEIVRKAQDPDSTIESIGAVIRRDLGMTAMVLKLVNSAFFGLGRNIASPEEAVSYLGLDTIKALVLSIHAFSQLRAPRIPGFEPEELWHHAMETAVAAREICGLENAGRSVSEQALVAGLLHDVGKLILASNRPDDFAQAVALGRNNGGTVLEAEREVFGATHADVGGYLLGLWGLPTPVVEATAFHHAPRLAGGKTFAPLTAVHVADAFYHQRKSPGTNGTGDGAALDLEYLRELGLLDHLESWKAGSEQHFDTPTIA